jgi:hypothetical protein
MDQGQLMDATQINAAFDAALESRNLEPLKVLLGDTTAPESIRSEINPAFEKALEGDQAALEALGTILDGTAPA